MLDLYILHKDKALQIIYEEGNTYACWASNTKENSRGYKVNKLYTQYHEYLSSLYTLSKAHLSSFH